MPVFIEAGEFAQRSSGTQDQATEKTSKSTPTKTSKAGGETTRKEGKKGKCTNTGDKINYIKSRLCLSILGIVLGENTC